MNQYKRWCLGFLTLFMLMLIGLIAFVVIIDPYFHYHKPLTKLEYPIDNQRYQNDGIIKHFEYDAMIIGTSMTENFKASELNFLFGVNSIKVPFSAGTYKEVNNNIEQAVKSNSELKLVVRGLDYDFLMLSENALAYTESAYPTYLYDDSYLNDIKYWMNKDVISDACRVLLYTLRGGKTPDFDTYCNWMNNYPHGKKATLEFYLSIRHTTYDEKQELSDSEIEILKKNLEQNVIKVAAENPDIEFYLFFPPYSICYWDNLKHTGRLEKQLEIEKYAAELLLTHDNIHLFSFWDEFDMICNLDNYRDWIHYTEDINSQMLIWMQKGEHELNRENYDEYWNNIYNFYVGYDYDDAFMKFEEEYKKEMLFY